MTPEELFLANLSLIERIVTFVARRGRMETAEGEELASTVKLKLIEDDYAVLRQFEGRSTLSTYLTIVIQRIALDYRIQQWGKWRPSAEAKRQGETAMQLEQLLHRDGLSWDEAVARLKSEQKTSDAELLRLRDLLPERAPRRRMEDDSEALQDLPSASRADDRALRHDRDLAARRTRDALRDVLASFDSEERLILRLRFSDSMKVSSMSTMLGVDQRKLYKKIDRLLETTRKRLLAAGISPLDAADIVEHGSDELRIDSLRRPEELFAVRPSDRNGADPHPALESEIGRPPT